MTRTAPIPGFVWTPVLILASGTVLSAQCNKPTIPARGLPTAPGTATATGTAIDVALIYSDGYKTLCNLTHPSSMAPACGWPLVVFVHGYGGRRSN